MINYSQDSLCKDNNEQDIEDLVSDNQINIKKNTLIPLKDEENIKNFVSELLKIKLDEDEKQNLKKYNEYFMNLRKKYKMNPKKSQIYFIYRQWKYKKIIDEYIELEKLLITKKMRSHSGVLVVSVIMPPDNFSCNYDCHYCPNDPRYSRSYYHGEPTVMRGERNKFNAYAQFHERIISYFVNGHNIDKIEIIILGGTFSCYDPKVCENFICSLFYAANNVFVDQSNLRPMYDIEKEKLLNENALAHVIGITIETRPDKITKYELRRYRKYGVTRVQIGIQHTDDSILKIINRECYQKDTIQALKLLKDNCFKVDIHIMPDLPGSNLFMDKIMFHKIIYYSDYQADQWKIYPCNVLEFTKIKEWYTNGTYKPYAESDFEGFFNLIVWVLQKMPPWIRVNRIQRDFPGNYIEGGNKFTNLRQMLDDKMKKDNLTSNDIRSMEVRTDYSNISNAKLVRVDYYGNDGQDIFLSHKSCQCKICFNYIFYLIVSTILSIFNIHYSYYGCGKEDKIYSFLRLRITKNDYNNCFSEKYNNKAKIRELHVYGRVNDTYSKNNIKSSQHVGFGKKLMYEAEKIAKIHQCDGLIVIAGVGTRNYYRKLNYEIDTTLKNHGEFMIKYI
jgi:elongator complex protein 3